MTRPAHLPALTGFRAVAALLVFLFHYRTGWSGLPAPWQGPWLALSSQFNLGVSLFFTLSGFLLFRQYSQVPWPGGRAFFGRRFARLYPLLFLLTTVAYLFSGPLRALPAGQWWTEYLLNLTLLKGLSARWHLTGIGPAWSLTVEEFFYLTLPGLLWCARRYRPVWWAAGAALLLAAGVALSYLLRGAGWLETTQFTLLGTFFGRSAEFLIGAAFARVPAGRLRYATTAGLGLLALSTGLLVLAARACGVAAAVECLPGVALNNWVLPWGTGLLLYGLATEPTGLRRVLSSRPAQVLGRSSYAFYLIHLGVFSDFLQGHLHRDFPRLPPLFTLFVLLTAGAILLHYLIEKPLHRMLIGLFRAS